MQRERHRDEGGCGASRPREPRQRGQAPPFPGGDPGADTGGLPAIEEIVERLRGRIVLEGIDRTADRLGAPRAAGTLRHVRVRLSGQEPLEKLGIRWMVMGSVDGFHTAPPMICRCVA